ncbi:MAG: di-heme oxidoredictase family protein, partial [Polyangiaceae bacterium]
PDDLLKQFNDGDSEFDTSLYPADGLGPLYTRDSCGGCHDNAARGPGLAQKMVFVLADGVTPADNQAAFLPFGATEHPRVVTETGAITPIIPPDLDGGLIIDPDAGDGGEIDAGTDLLKVTIRLGPPVLGRGYMEAVSDSEILRMESEQASRTDGIHGHVNHLTFASVPNPDQTYDKYKTGDAVIGRFGLKARIATLDEFVADALQSDMGLTSPMRPTEFANPDGITDDLKPGVDLTADKMNVRAMYMRLIAIPARPVNDAGKTLFEKATCNVCHAESLKTRADYPVAVLANIDAPIYTDMILHDMGDALSDSVTGGNEGQAGPRDWRTSALIGLRFNHVFLHDGRAATISDAILQHDGTGSEAHNAVSLYKALSPTDQQTLLQFVGSL